MSNIKESLAPRIVTLTDGSTVDIDASSLGPRGGIARLQTTNNPTINPPSNPIDGQTFTLEITAQSADRTPTLSTSAGGFAFGSDITTVSAVVANKFDRIGFAYRLSANKWMVTAYLKGFTP